MRSIFRHKSTLLTAGLILLISSGCGDKPSVVESSYSDEMTSFIVESDSGKELFMQNVYANTPFYLSYDSLHQYYYKFDSTQRSISISIADSPITIFPFESVYDAVGTVVDHFYGHLYRIIPGDTIPAYKVRSDLTRYAYFLKLYGDTYQYRGWRFWGFSGGRPSSAGPTNSRLLVSLSGITRTAAPPAQAPHVQDPEGHYINDDSIPKYPLGDSLTLNTYFQDIINTEKGDLGLKAINALPDGIHFKTGWKIPSSSDKFYHLILFDMPGTFLVDTVNQVIESTLIKINDYVIPYKVDI